MTATEFVGAYHNLQSIAASWLAPATQLYASTSTESITRSRATLRPARKGPAPGQGPPGPEEGQVDGGRGPIRNAIAHAFFAKGSPQEYATTLRYAALYGGVKPPSCSNTRQAPWLDCSGFRQSVLDRSGSGGLQRLPR